MTYIYDKYLDLIPLHAQSMRFKGEASKIDYLTHVNNLVVKAILKSLSSSTHKEACAFLDRVKDKGWEFEGITMPLAAKDIVILWIMVL
jgi:hypothetical protein